MAKRRVYSVFGEAYVIDKDKKVLYFSGEKGDFIVPFTVLDEMVKAYKNVNRIHKPMYLLFYTDWKNRNLSDWKYKDSDVPDSVFSKFEMVK